ncbi:MAG: amino acid permease [Planctomycetota bacterium]|jgi:amino acid transporter/mannitol/fructose-specific phosphotransferase system IIA component (Ntr-type)
MEQITTLKKQLRLLDVFCVAAGAMISSGLFVLPAIAYTKAGPAVILAYLFASLLVIPSFLSQAELTTAMPRAGGTYFFVERSLGPTVGFFGGLAGWFSLALKSAFAIVGIALLVEVALQKIFAIQLSGWHLKMIAVICCVGFITLNTVSVKHTSRFQVALVLVLLVILAGFVFGGASAVQPSRYSDFMEKGWLGVLATAGLVFISFGGLTKVASIAEEVTHPGRNLPLGMILAWFVVSAFYIAVIIITVGVLDGSELAVSYAPVSLAASKFAGGAGFVLLSLAAVAAFITTANGGILAASRCPMAMSRDNLLPPILARVSRRFNTPHISILLTGAFMVLAIVFLDIESLVKTASTLMIILFVLANASVIIMRESKIQSYRPQFKSPLYPYIQIFAIVAYGALIIDMGKVPLLICAAFVLASAAWYVLYVSKRVARASAAMHIVKRVTDIELQTVTLEDELRDILIERDEIIEDRFDQLVKKCEILDIKGKQDFLEVFRKAAHILSGSLGANEYVLLEKFIYRESQGSTVIQPGLAIPHIIVEGRNKFDILLIRAAEGISFSSAPDPVTTIFVLAGSKDERNYHLRALMAIAQISQEADFERRWLTATGPEQLRNLILLSKRKRDTN